MDSNTYGVGAATPKYKLICPFSSIIFFGASVVVGATICESAVYRVRVVRKNAEKMKAKENVRLMFAWCKEQVEPNVRRQRRGEEARSV